MSLTAGSRGTPGRPIQVGRGGMRVLIVGDPAAGKTHLLKTLALDPRSSPALILDTTGGTVGISEEVLAAGSAIYTVTDADNFLEWTRWLRLPENKGKFKSLAVDDFSAMFLAQKSKEMVKAGGPTAVELDGKKYDAVYEAVRRGFLAVQSLAAPVEDGGLGMHTLFTAWADKKLDREKNDAIVPYLAGKFNFEAIGWFDVVGYLEGRYAKEGGKQKFQNKLTTQTDGVLKVRDRTNRLSVVYNPTATILLDAWEGAGTSNGEATK
jgi:hypothetical protein